MRKGVILTAGTFGLTMVLLAGVGLFGATRSIPVADPRAHVVGNETDGTTYGLVNNFPKSELALDTLSVKSGTVIKYITDASGVGDGCEGVWYPNAPSSAIGFQFILNDADEDTVIQTSSQTWQHQGPDPRPARVTCEDNGPVAVWEQYSGPQGTLFHRQIDMTSVVIQQGDPQAPPDTTARDFYPLEFWVEIDSLAP